MDRDTAKSILLRLDDFPSGWQAQARGPSSDTVPELRDATTKLASCLEVDPALVRLDADDASRAKAVSDRFTDGKNYQVEADATLDASSDAAQTALAAFRRSEAPGCFQDYVSTVIRYGLAHPASGQQQSNAAQVGDVQAAQVNLPGVDGDAINLRVTLPLTVSGFNTKFVIDFIVVVKGRAGMVIQFSNQYAPFPSDLEVRMANKMIDRAPNT